MRAVWPFVHLSLAGRPRRSVLLTVAILLSAALVATVTSLVASGQAGVERRIERSIGRTDAMVSHLFDGTFDDRIVEEVRRWPGVAAAGGRLRGSLTLVRADGARDEEDRLRRITVECRGFDLADAERFDQLELEAGRLPQAPQEVVLDPLTARHLDATVGTLLEVQRFGDPIALEVVGIQRRPILGALQRPVVQIDRGTLADAINTPGRLSAIALILAPDTDVASWCEDRRVLLPDDLTVEPSERVRGGFDRHIAGSRLGLTLGAVLAFLSCSFIVATGMTTAVVEQQRLLAITRCIGAARWHLLAGQLLCGAILGGVGGVLGVPVGMFLAWLVAWLRPDLLSAGLVVPGFGVQLALLGAIGAGLLGAAYPAVQASRVPPLEALAAQAKPLRLRGIALAAAIGLALVAIQIALLAIPDRDQRFLVYSFVGMPLLHIGAFLVAPAVLVLLGRSIGPAIARLLRLPAGVLAGSIGATPYRLGFTAGALMVGLAILVSTWSNGEAVIDNLRERMRFADGFAFRTSGLSPAQQEQIARLPGVVESCPVGYLPLQVIGQQVFGLEGFAPPSVIAVGFDPERFLRLNRLEWIRGTPEQAIPRLRQGDALLVAEQFLTARGLDVGDTIVLGNPRRSVEFEIVGVVGAAGLDMATQMFGMRSLYNEQAISCVFLDFDAVTRHFGSREAYIMQLQLAPGLEAEDEALLADLIASTVPGTVFASGRGIREIIDRVGNTVLGVSTAVAGGALLLAALGVGNVIAAGIAARRFEFGLMRAVGASRGTVARLVLAEAILVAATATVVGSLLGMQLAEMGRRMYRELAGIELAFILPIGPLAAGATVLLLIAMAASAPAVLGLLRRPTVELLAAGRAG
jgi:putative ABC transport system permease protein